MYRKRLNTRMSMLFVFFLLLCEVCFIEHPSWTFCQTTSSASIHAETQNQSVLDKQVIDTQQSMKTKESSSLGRKTKRRTITVYTRELLPGCTRTDDLSRISTIAGLRVHDEISFSISNHLKLIRYIYQKDGKKQHFSYL